MKDKYGLLLITADVGFITIKTAIMRCVIQYGDVPESEESEKQDKTGHQLKQTCCSRALELLRKEVDSKEKGEIQEDYCHDFQIPYSSSAKMRLTFSLI